MPDLDVVCPTDKVCDSERGKKERYEKLAWEMKHVYVDVIVVRELGAIGQQVKKYKQ